MGYRRNNAHGCSHPGCERKVTHDLVLSERTVIERRFRSTTYKSNSSRIIHHLYLCDEHWPEMFDFMDAYEGR